MRSQRHRRRSLATLALAILMLLTSASCMALRCRESGTNATTGSRAIDVAAISSIAQNLPNYTIVWTSPELQLDVTCDSNNYVRQDEDLHFYFDPESRRDQLGGIEAGIFYNGSVYWANAIVNTGQPFRFGRGAQNFSFRYKILLRKRPFGGTTPISLSHYSLFRVDSIYAASADNYRQRITNLQAIRFVECRPLLPALPHTTSNGAAPRSLAIGGGAVFQAGFEVNFWSGVLIRRSLWFDYTIPQTNGWYAHIQDADQRHIYTSTGNDKPESQIRFFTWDTLSPEQQTLFQNHPIGGRSDNRGRERVAYLRGDQRQESGNAYHPSKFRSRLNRLGDIVNSSVQYVGPPSGLLPAQYANRRPAVYVGANDGMLHAFDAETGAELFAYIPRMLINKLPALTEPGYTHQAYVDGAITAAEVPTANGNGWRTVLVAGLGAGSQGAIALDISDPGNFANAGGVLWEFSKDDDADMGHVTAAPLIASFNLGTDARGRPQQRHFAILASGPRNVLRSDANGPGVLFLLVLDQPVTRWIEGVNYFKLKTPSSTLQLEGDALATPGIALASDGTVKALYAGDLQGHLWHFDFSTVSSSKNLARITPVHLFTATDNDGRRQAINTRPQVVHAPHGGLLVLFGSGRVIDHADLNRSGFTPQSFYAVRDSGRDVDLNRSHLTVRHVNARPATNYNRPGFEITGTAPDYQNDTPFGWYLDFPDRDNGERLIYDPLVVQKQLFFNTWTASNGACPLINSRSYRLDVLTGVSNDITGFVSDYRFNALFGAPIAYTTRPYNHIPAQVNILAAFNGVDNAPEPLVLHRFDAASSNTVTAGRGVKSWNWKEIPDWRNTRRPTLKGKSP